MIYRGIEIVQLDIGPFAWCCDERNAADIADSLDAAKCQIDDLLGGDEPQWIEQATFDDLCELCLEHRDWVCKLSKEWSADGCTWLRYTANESDTAFLLEGWRRQPDNEGAPRWDQAPKRPVKHEPDLKLNGG